MQHCTLLRSFNAWCFVTAVVWIAKCLMVSNNVVWVCAHCKVVKSNLIPIWLLLQWVICISVQWVQQSGRKRVLITQHKSSLNKKNSSKHVTLLILTLPPTADCQKIRLIALWPFLVRDLWHLVDLSLVYKCLLGHKLYCVPHLNSSPQKSLKTF